MKKLFIILLFILSNCAHRQLTEQEKQDRMQKQMNMIYLNSLQQRFSSGN